MLAAPGNLQELSAASAETWSEHIAGEIDGFAARFEQFLSAGQLAALQPGALTVRPVRWPAFPSELDSISSREEALAAAEERDNQDEYSEWAVQKSGDEIVRVTFTTETPDYFDHLLEHEPQLLGQVYSRLSGEAVDPEQLRGDDGLVRRDNSFNRGPNGQIVHLSQASNTLGAAIRLAAEATVLREIDGRRITDKKELVICGQLGGPLRNSDPQIAIAVNQLAADGFELSLADPLGLYIDEFLSGGLHAPDGADVSQFWTLEDRGDPTHPMRAHFAVPPERGYSVSEIRDGQSQIRFGSQLAQRVRVRLSAAGRPGDHQPTPQPCQ